MIKRLRAMVPSREQMEANRWLRGLAPYLSNPKLWHWSRRSVALGAAIGLFIGFLVPVAQILLAAAAAVFLRANVAVAAAGTLVTNPLTIAPIYYAAYQLGAWATGSPARASVSLSDPSMIADTVGANLVALFAGLAIAAVTSAIGGYLLISRVWIRRVAASRRATRRR